MDREELILGITADIESATSNLETLQSQLDELQTDWDLPALEAEVSAQVENAAQVKADLEAELADALRLDATVDVDTTGANTGLDDIRTKSGEASSAIGQMSSNSVSELGDMAGAGSAVSQGLGDIANAATQGRISLGDLAAIAVPMAALGAFVQGIRGHLERIETIEAFDAEQVEAFADAIRQAGDDVANLVDSLDSTQRITGISQLSGEVIDITNDLADAGVSADSYFQVLRGGGDAVNTFIDSLEEQGVSEESVNRIRLVAIDNLRNLEQGTLDAAGSNAVFTESQVSANQALQALLNEQDPMRQFTSEWDLLKESMSDGSIDTTAAADALNTLKDELGLTTEQVLELAQADLAEVAEGALAFADAWNSIDFQAAELQGATTAFAEFTTGLFAAGNEVQAEEEAFDALKASVEGVAFTMNAGTAAGRAQQDALEGVARVLDVDLAQAYDAANGNQDAFIESATKLGEETLARLQTDLGLTDEQVTHLAEVLGLTEGDYEARFALAGAEEARLQLELLGGAIEGLPDDIEMIVTQQILAGDFVAARDTVAQYYADNPVTLETEADTSGAEGDLSAAAESAPGATIVATADTVQAATDLLDEADEPRTATIVAHARTAGAEIDLAALADAERIAEIDVVTGSINMPSASQLVSLATGGQGRIVVPIVGRWSTRIEGSRPI